MAVTSDGLRGPCTELAGHDIEGGRSEQERRGRFKGQKAMSPSSRSSKRLVVMDREKTPNLLSTDTNWPTHRCLDLLN